MNTPSPLIPQGSLQQQSRGKSNVRLAVSVFTVIALHAAFFSGLLMQGCKRDTDSAGAKGGTNTNSMAEAIGKLDSSYLDSAADLPKAATNLSPSNLGVSSTGAMAQPQPAVAETPIVQPSYQPSSPITTFQPPAAEASAETKEYTVIRGDNLYKIAKSQGVTVGDITKANPELDPRHLKPGQKLQIPKSSATTVAPTGAGSVAETAAAPNGTTIHVVKPGDNLTRIAAQYKTTVKAIRSANGLKTDRLLAGQKLKVPSSPAKQHAAATGTNTDRLPALPGTASGTTNR